MEAQGKPRSDINVEGHILHRLSVTLTAFFFLPETLPNKFWKWEFGLLFMSELLERLLPGGAFFLVF